MISEFQYNVLIFFFHSNLYNIYFFLAFGKLISYSIHNVCMYVCMNACLVVYVCITCVYYVCICVYQLFVYIKQVLSVVIQ